MEASMKDIEEVIINDFIKLDSFINSIWLLLLLCIYYINIINIDIEEEDYQWSINNTVKHSAKIAVR